MNLYLFGGAFDPPHLGHNEIIKYFAQKADILLISPSYFSPLKRKRPQVNYDHRRNMIKLMLESLSSDNTSIIDYEFENKFIYSIDTIRFLETKYSDCNINMIIGFDQYMNIELWKEYEYIIDNINLQVIKRPGIDDSMKKYSCQFIDDISMDVSSTQIRYNIHNSNAIQSLLHKDVFEYIKDNKLYK